jgi:hypothetical protein
MRTFLPILGQAHGARRRDSTVGAPLESAPESLEGIAPNQVLASRIVNGAVVRSRRLCPYPQVARYKGTGSLDEAANFSCVSPQG